MTELIHHNIMHFNDIKLLSLEGNVRINTTAQNKVYINSDTSTLTINENIALGFGKDVVNYGAIGDVIVSNGDQGSMWSNKVSLLEARIEELEEYIIEMKFFMKAFSKAVYLEETPSKEFDYFNLL